jgi:hypothetical protein
MTALYAFEPVGQRLSRHKQRVGYGQHSNRCRKTEKVGETPGLDHIHLLFSVAPIVVALDLAGCAPRRMSMPLLSWAGLRSHVKPILEHKGNRGVLKRLEFF